MTPTLIGIILACILAVIFGPPLFDMLREYGVPLIKATFHRFFTFEWHGIMSSIADDDGTEPLVPGLVLGGSDAANTGTWIPVSETLSRADLLDILARQRADGKYVFTGNKLADLFAGSVLSVSRNTILDEIAAIRGTRQPPAQPPRSIYRPRNGWQA